MLEAGIKGEQSVEVVYENTATAVGSGVLEVFGTPCMLALMEKTASESVAPIRQIVPNGIAIIGFNDE